MTKMLASVNSIAEALLVLEAGVDIIDLKQPALGALGALDSATVRQIVIEVNRRCPVSATIGDIPLQPQLVFNAVKAMAETGVDYVKIGFFPGDDGLGTLNQLSLLTAQGYRLIAVLFADTPLNYSVLTALKEAGFTGVMLDTLDKKSGSLTQLMSPGAMTAFVKQAKALDLLCGLAGSLRLDDISSLLPYQADYLGFRGALCEGQIRVGQLNTATVLRIRRAIK
jgi:(5-formylfuran-3-yl)methyl phosphate synthase